MSIQTKDEADLATRQRWEQERKTNVFVLNRFGRPVEVSLFQAKNMVKNGEGEIITAEKAAEVVKEHATTKVWTNNGKPTAPVVPKTDSIRFPEASVTTLEVVTAVTPEAPAEKGKKL